MNDNNPRWPKYGFSGLLALLVSFFIINPFLLTTNIGNAIIQLSVSGIMIMILYILRRKKQVLYFAIPLIIFALALSWYNLFDYSFSREVIAYTLKLIFLLIAIFSIIRLVRQYKTIDSNIIVGALCIYIMFALAWGLLYTLVELIVPESFEGRLLHPEDKTDLDRTNSIFTSLIYYSVVTITTLGFGDIYPASHLARSLTSLEVLFGVFYLGTLISTLIGLRLYHLDHGSKS